MGDSYDAIAPKSVSSDASENPNQIPLNSNDLQNEDSDINSDIELRDWSRKI